MKAIIHNDAYNNSDTTCNDLQTIAFDSHPTCYVENDFCNEIFVNEVNIVCLKKVFSLADFFSIQAIDQVYKLETKYL